MGGGKGSSSETKVADYLMSLHFGICKGPLDSINSIYVKELRVWCGQLTADSVVYIDLPELFGGDTKEGGVSGVVEAYFGGPSQVMNPTVAARYGKTSTTMPGYRGIANVFFRGYQEEEVPQRSAPSGLFGMLFSAFSDLFNDFAQPVQPAGGFKWITNNPYLPGAWVNATRCPRGLSNLYATIYSEAPDYLLEKPIPGTAINSQTFHTIAALGWTAEEIDAGLVTISTVLQATFTGVGLGAGTVMSGYVGIEQRFYADNGSGGVGSEFVSERVSDFGIVSGGGTKSEVKVIPAGTRHIRIHPQIIPTYPIFSTFGSGADTSFKTSKAEYGPSYCTIDNHLGVLPDANPAHMIYEALTDGDWGMGATRDDIDLTSFMAAAETFYNEKLGLSILWTDQTEIEKYIAEILDHVQAALFIDPRTGLWQLVPFRADYDIDDLPVLDPSNCKATNRQRKALGETVNEIVISWTNPNNEKDETITFQDLGNIAAQGGVVSSTRNYYGVRNPALANFLGQRDIRSASYPLFSCNIVADRSMSFLTPGSVVKFSWPEDGIVSMVLRVSKVDYGKPGDSSIRLTVAEDVFGLETTEYTSIQETEWTESATAPTPMDYTEFLTAPLPLLLRSGFTLADLSDDDYPIVSNLVLSKRQGGGLVQYFDLMGPVTLPTGAVTTGKLAGLPPTPSNLSSVRFVDEPVTRVAQNEITRFCGFDTPTAGDFLHIQGTDGDRTSEIIMLDFLESGVWNIARGMFDTVIRDWPVGTRVWFLGDSLTQLDPTENNSGAISTYQLLPKSDGGLLPLADAPVLTFTPSDRPYAPFRPSNVQLTAVGGTPLTPHPLDLQNPSGEDSLTGWTETNMTTVTSISYTPVLTPKKGSRFFACDNGVASAFMEQLLSVPLTRIADADAGALEMSARWWQAGFDTISDPARIEVDFYDATDTLISTFVGPNHFGGAQAWAFQYEVWTAPVGTRSYVFRVAMTRTAGSNLNCAIDDIVFGLSAGVYPPLGYTGSEVPTSLTVSWSHRNRLTEDTVAARWEQPTVTPEVGQTTTVRVVDAVSGAVESEATGLAGTTYNLVLGSLINYRFYRVEVFAERDGYESIQGAFRNIQVVQLGYGNNYGFDYGENDGS